MEVFPRSQKFLSSALNIEDIDHPHPAQDLFLGDLVKLLCLMCMVWHIIWRSFDFPRGDPEGGTKALLKTTGSGYCFHTQSPFFSKLTLEMLVFHS